MYFYIKYIGKLAGLMTKFQRSMVFETDEFERPKFDCTQMDRSSLVVVIF